MLWRFQRRAGGSPGPIAKPFGRGPQAAKPPAAMKAAKLFSSDRRHARRLFLHLELSSQVQRSTKENFEGGLPAETFTRTMIEQIDL